MQTVVWTSQASFREYSMLPADVPDGLTRLLLP
jgi:hypothetical protein